MTNLYGNVLLSTNNLCYFSLLTVDGRLEIKRHLIESRPSAFSDDFVTSNSYKHVD